ncbi:hypothetical protein [Streptomyces sp. NBC_00566]|uniref:hypothetical protein n=1 Tax=Streptomyces sp. NBC_00566 TaxID=2975778 RepID=UPI002E80921A|nr:hypothetical protein [Streptomyces sp. NBC_00566]WUB85517.1 hypothetical protein OG812_02440 [Streptomyces sp. NBC_00566]
MNDFWTPTQFWTPAHFAVEQQGASDGMTPMQMAEYYDHTLAIDLSRRHISKRAPQARTARPARGVLPGARLWAL